MLIRIRRLAGSVVGAAFILLLSLSMLQTGNSLNPVAFFQGSPLIIEVGDEKQRWNTFGLSDAVANTFGLSAPDYAPLGYGPLITALAIKDSWNGGDLTLSSELQEGLQIGLRQQGAFFTPDSLGAALDRVEPMANILTALDWRVESQNALLPTALGDIPKAQVTQAYDFDLIELRNDTTAVPAPEEATLQTYVEENPDQFERPQTWAIEALILEDTALAEQIDVTEDQVRLYYDQNPDAFIQAESWDYQTLNFATALEANLFKSQIDQGVDYETAVSASTAVVDGQGLQDSSAFSAETLDTLAQLSADDVGVLNGPDDADDGSVTFTYLKAYVPETVETLDTAYAQAEDMLQLKLAKEQLSETILDLQRQANGDDLSLAEVAQAQGYETQTFENLQTARTAPAALNSPGLFERLSFIQESRPAASRYELEPGTREMLFTVTSYEAPRPFTFDEARDDALLFWTDEQARKHTLEQAESLADTLRTGAAADALVAELDDETITLERRENLSRLALDTIDNPEFDLIAGLDRAAQARFTGRIAYPLDRGILTANPRVISPFTLQDGDVMVVDVIGGQAVILAHQRDAAPDQDMSEGDADQADQETQESQEASDGDANQDASETLIDLLADTSAANMFAQSLLLTYLNDVSSDRPATIDQAVIDAQILAAQQAAASQSSGGI